MQKKIVNITYEEIEISEEVRKKCNKYLTDNEITLYWDYQDQLSLAQVDNIMESEEKFNEIENEIWENSLDYICDLENELLSNMKEEFSELKEIELSELREEFMDYISIDMNVKQLLRNTPAVNIRVVIHSNYEGVNYADRGNGDFQESEYIQDIKKLIKGKYDQKSFQDELDNICSCVNQFIFYGKCDVEDLIGIKEKFKKSITISKNSWSGFFDAWSGSGSVLEVKLQDNITLKKHHGKTEYDSVDIILDQNNNYSVMDVYGMCNIPEISISVK